MPLWKPFTWRVLREPVVLAVVALLTSFLVSYSKDAAAAALTLAALAVAVPALAAAYSLFQFNAYISYSFSSDLKDIQAFYMDNKEAPNSCLWVAEATVQNGDGTAKPVVVGCVALESLSAQQAELRRMSVDAKWQRRGIAAQLCRALLAHAKQTGHKEVILTTSEMQQGACKFYEAMGWQEVEQGRLVWPMCYHKFSMAL
jgi:GNAT superfamily N-acetyltransferase